MENTIPKQYLVLLDNLKTTEGGYLHHNEKEIDITNGWGIYRGTGLGKDFKPLWDYIDSVAKQVTSKPSPQWTLAELQAIDKLLDKNIELNLTYTFYKEYFKDARLHLFPSRLVILMSNLYTNSPKGAWMSIQEGLRDLVADKILLVDIKDLSIVDGNFGDKTEKALNLFLSIADRKDEIIFKKSVLLAMKSYYIDLSISNPTKFLGNLNGWDNRMENLEHQE